MSDPATAVTPRTLAEWYKGPMTALLLCAAIAGAAAPPSAADDASAVMLRGRVVDAQTGEAIAKAVVT